MHAHTKSTSASVLTLPNSHTVLQCHTTPFSDNHQCLAHPCNNSYITSIVTLSTSDVRLHTVYSITSICRTLVTTTTLLLPPRSRHKHRHMSSGHKISDIRIGQPNSDRSEKRFHLKGTFPTMKGFCRDLWAGMTNGMIPVILKISHLKRCWHSILIVPVGHLIVALLQVLLKSLPFLFQSPLATSLM